MHELGRLVVIDRVDAFLGVLNVGALDAEALDKHLYQTAQGRRDQRKQQKEKGNNRRWRESSAEQGKNMESPVPKLEIAQVGQKQRSEYHHRNQSQANG